MRAVGAVAGLPRLAGLAGARRGPAFQLHVPQASIPAHLLSLTPNPTTAHPPPRADYQGEEYVHALGDRMFNSEPERAGQRLLKDFRTLALGKICLELPRAYEHVREV